MEKKALRLGAAAILFALGLRLLGAAASFADAGFGGALLFLQTGRIVKTGQNREEEPTLQTQAVIQPQTQKAQAVFSPADSSLVTLNNATTYAVAVETCLQQSLSWDLQQDAPTVLILHTHGTEGYVEAANFRTQNTEENVVAVGERLQQLLEEGGVQALHDKTMYDLPSYNGSYEAARQAISRTLEQYPSICMVLDLHRDAAVGKQMNETVPCAGGQAAKLMLVMGTDAGGSTHPQWQENLSLAVKLQTQLEKLCPDICKPISLRKQRFNQDLSAGALLVEVGATGNTRQEALNAAEILAQAILSLAQGAATESSTTQAFAPLP